MNISVQFHRIEFKIHIFVIILSIGNYPIIHLPSKTDSLQLQMAFIFAF